MSKISLSKAKFLHGNAIQCAHNFEDILRCYQGRYLLRKMAKFYRVIFCFRTGKRLLCAFKTVAIDVLCRQRD